MKIQWQMIGSKGHAVKRTHPGTENSDKTGIPAFPVKTVMNKYEIGAGIAGLINQVNVSRNTGNNPVYLTSGCPYD